MGRARETVHCSSILMTCKANENIEFNSMIYLLYNNNRFYFSRKLKPGLWIDTLDS